MRFISSLALLLMLLAPVRAADKVPVIFDNDIGTDIDDAFALGLVLVSPELELKGVTSVSADAYGRAMIAARFLNLSGFDNVPVASQKPPQAKPMIEGQFQYGLRPLWRKGPVKESAVDFLYSQLKAEPGKLTLLAVGDLTNVGKLLTEKPDCKPWIKRIVIMGGAVRVGYKPEAPAGAGVEHQIRHQERPGGLLRRRAACGRPARRHHASAPRRPDAAEDLRRQHADHQPAPPALRPLGQGDADAV